MTSDVPPPAQPVDDTAAKEDRLSNTTAFLPIVYGSIAFYLGKKADEFQTHEWTLFLRGPNNEDLSMVISKVVFQLHASFAQPIREYTEPPFEVTERGWGEFEAQIRIHWKDSTEKVTIVSSIDDGPCAGELTVQNEWLTSRERVFPHSSTLGQSYYSVISSRSSANGFISCGRCCPRRG
jgi:YEATS domain-containing protein 4